MIYSNTNTDSVWDSTLTYKDIEKAVEKLRGCDQHGNFDTVVGHPSITDQIPDQYGIRIIGNPMLTETRQTKFPRSKKKRIRKKFAKKYTENVPSESVYCVNTDKLFNYQWKL